MRTTLYSFLVLFFSVAAIHAAEEMPLGESHQASGQEKISLHHDRDIYVAGEPVFFRLQLLLPSGSSSTIAYLVLRNDQSSNILELAVPLEEGQASSALMLPDTLRSGYYELVAFTNYMRNAGEESFFRSQLFVANRFDQQAGLIESFHKGYEPVPLQFFPEGGKLVAGVASKVAVTTGEAAIQADATAWLVDQQGDTLEQIVFRDPDVNFFSITPSAGSGYYLLCGDGSRLALPPVGQGVGMSISKRPEGVEVSMHPSLQAEGAFSLEVLTCGGTLQREVTLRGQPVSILFEAGKVPPGILGFLLKDPEGKIVSHRMWYHHPGEMPLLEVVLPDHRAGTRRRVAFSLHAAGMGSEAVSVSVVQAGLLFNARQKLLKQLLLQSHSLEGYQQLVRQAAGKGVGDDLNDLLMVAGLPDQSPLREQPQVHLRETKGFSLAGRLVDAQSGQGIAGATIYLSTPDTLLNFNYATTLTDGRFYFLLDEYYHGRELILQVAGDDLATSGVIEVTNRFELNQPFRPVVCGDSDHHLETIADLQKIVAVQKHYGSRSEVVACSRDLPVKGPQPLFYEANLSVRPADYVALDDFQEIAREIIFPLRIRSLGEGRYSARVVNARSGGFFEQDPVFFLDAVPVHDPGQIMDLSSDDLLRVDVHNIPWRFGDLSFDGIISLVSENNKGRQLELPGARRITAPEFATRLRLQNSPEAEDRGVMVPDFRPVLAWLPGLIAGQDIGGLSFVSGDLKGDYLIIVNGMTPEGNPVVNLFPFEIY